VLRNILHWEGIPHFLIEVIKCMYDGSRICFKTNIGKYMAKINLGVRQGCSTLPVMFNLYLEDAARRQITADYFEFSR
jgi:hypothetical protein